MKAPDQIKPNYAPVYAAARYPELCLIFQRHGYAFSVHGSLARDFDLIAVPWGENLSLPNEVLKEVMVKFAVRMVDSPEEKLHGRLAYTMSIGWGECACDISFFLIPGTK